MGAKEPKLSVAVTANLTDFNRKMAQASSITSKTTKAITKSFKRMGVATAVVGAAIGVKAVKSFAKFEQGMADVRAITNATGKDFLDMTAKAKNLGATTEFTAAQSADAMKELGKAGFNTKEIMSGIDGVLLAASAAGIELSQAADIVASSLRGFGLEADQAARVSDVLSKASNISNTTMMGLGEAMKFVAPVAKATGQSIEGVTALLGAMGDAGIKGSMGGRALRMSLVALIKPTAEAQTVIDKLGIQSTDSAGRMVPFVDVVDQLAKSGATTADVVKIFGAESASAILALKERGAPALKELETNLLGAAGAAKKMQEIRLDTITGQATLLGSAMDGMAIAVGAAIEKEGGIKRMLSAMGKGVTSATTKSDGLVKSLSSLVRDGFVFMIRAAAVASQALVLFQNPIAAVEISMLRLELATRKKAAADIFAAAAGRDLSDGERRAAASFLEGTLALQKEIQVKSEAFDSTTRLAVINAELQVILDAATAATNSYTGAVKAEDKAVQSLGASLKEQFAVQNELNDMFKGQQSKPPKPQSVVTPGSETSGDKGGLVLDVILPVIESAMSGVAAAVQIAFVGLAETTDAFLKLIGSELGETGFAVFGVAGQIVGMLSSLGKMTTEGFEAMIDGFLKAFIVAFENVGPLVEAIIRRSPFIVKSIVRAGLLMFSSIGEAIVNLVGDFIKWMGDQLKEPFQKAGDFFGGAFSDVGDAISGVFHAGGPVPGVPGQESLILARAGETISTPESMGGGGTTVVIENLSIGGGAGGGENADAFLATLRGLTASNQISGLTINV